MDKNRQQTWFGLAGLLTALVLSLFNSSCAPGTSLPATATPSTMDDRNLTAIAFQSARTYGLSGDPKAYRAVRMTLGEWAALNNAGVGGGAPQFGFTPDRPVFVLAIIGQIDWKGVGGARPDATRPTRYEGMTIVLDAMTGDLVWASANPSASSMPVPVPLNPFTPAAPISVQTRPPQSPPTLVPTSTPESGPAKLPSPIPTATGARPAYP